MEHSAACSHWHCRNMPLPKELVGTTTFRSLLLLAPLHAATPGAGRPRIIDIVTACLHPLCRDRRQLKKWADLRRLNHPSRHWKNDAG